MVDSFCHHKHERKRTDEDLGQMDDENWSFYSFLSLPDLLPRGLQTPPTDSSLLMTRHSGWFPGHTQLKTDKIKPWVNFNLAL